MNMNASQSSMIQGEEPPMYLQRPSSARSQDVSHVLASTFRQLFTRDPVAPDTVQYLNTSRGGEDPYHEAYVEALQKIQAERERRLAEAAMLERHIMQAQARAMSADEKQLNRSQTMAGGFPDLGLPPVRSHFRSCIDTALLRKHNLITPEDFATEEHPAVPPPAAPPIPSYARETQSSSRKKLADPGLGHMETPLPSASDSMQSISHHVPSESEFSSSIGSLPHIPETENLPYPNPWKEQMRPEEREVNRNDLANLQSRVDYLKNPRHNPTQGARTLVKSSKRRPKEVGIKPKVEKESSKDPSIIFVPTPNVVKFTDYQVGQVYELTLELKNITTVLRPVRVIPPKTQYFAVGLGQFPGDQGLVAPGMNCHYTIRFSPDSLADYDDEIIVQTQASEPIVVQLQGRRPPPVLTLPDNIDIGQCLVGGVKVAQVMVRNDGGTGRFCMMHRKSWPATNFRVKSYFCMLNTAITQHTQAEQRHIKRLPELVEKKSSFSVTATGAVTMPPFEIRPAVFELDRGSSVSVDVLFAPGDVKTYSQEMTMVCDNCHVRHFTITGEGQTAGVELVSVEEGLTEPEPGELCDITAQHLVKFENLNPFTYLQKSVQIKNTTNVELPFDWVVVKPYIKPKDPSVEDEVIIPNERVQDIDSVFSIEPEKGVLPPGATAEFKVTFAPPAVQHFHNVLHLVLRNIPKVSPVQEVEEERGGRGSVIPTSEPIVEDVTALEIETKGVCEPLSVLLQPYAIHIPGQVLVETCVKRQFRMLNHSISSVLFQWENLSSSNHIVEVEPPIGELGAQCEMDFELSVCGNVPGSIEHTLFCHVQHLSQPLTLHVKADIKGPEVQIEQSDINFGLVRVGTVAKEKITINNTSRVPAVWSIREAVTHVQNGEALLGSSEFVFKPSQGTLRPLDTRDILVTFTPVECRSLRTVFELHVEDGTEGAISVIGEVQQPEVCLLSSQVVMDGIYLDVQTSHQVTLLNQTLLPTTFEWGQLEGCQADICSVSVEPKKGHLRPREQLEINVNFTAHRTGEMSDLRVPCKVGGMEQPIIMALFCEVRGLSVSYRTWNDEEKHSTGDPGPLKLDFGNGLKIGDTPKCHLFIKNNSAINAPFMVTVEEFFAKPPTPPEKRPEGVNMPNKSQRRQMLAKTPNLADPYSKTVSKAQSDLCKAMLREGKGAAFTVSPASGVLQPFGEQVIEVSGYSDMWGDYSDRLICKVEKLDLVYIPLSMSVTGQPLHFQMVAATPHQQPILRFGTHVSGIGPITRHMRINNTAPFDIRLDWKVFNNDTESSQLLDFMVTYGKPFPLKDAAGAEIIPADDCTPPHPYRRPPTGFIPNSPDSTPAISQLESYGEDSTTALSLADLQPKVISVQLRHHGGKESNSPYDIIPSQVVIPAKSNTSINVSFTPFDQSDVSQGLDCMGYALGYVSLEDKVAEKDGMVTRAQAYEVSPLRLDMTATVKPALLTIECTEDEGMRYRAAASDMMCEGSLAPECLKLCSSTLSNMTETPLHFRLVSQDPFQVVQMDPDTNTPVAQLLQTDVYTLKPRQNALVQLAFRISLDLLEYLEALGSESEGKHEGVDLEEVDHDRKLHFKQNLLIEFNNGSSQKLPLYATLNVPALVLSKESLDFGTCLVGQQREMQIILSNPTASDSYWTCVVERKSKTCEGSTFQVTPVNGMLEAHITHISNSRVLIRIYFTAKHTEAYEIVYIFHGMLGEQPRRLFLKGQGSYDGKHEAHVNI